VGNPIASALGAAKKIERLFESEGAILVLTFHDDPEDSSIRYRAKYASLPLAWTLLTNFSYFAIVIAALLGLLSAEKGPLWWICLGALASWIVVHAVYFGGGRFHFPLMPLLTAFAAQFLAEPQKRYQSLSRLQKGLALACVLVFCTLWFIEGYVVFHG
jgi:hypothetical protein